MSTILTILWYGQFGQFVHEIIVSELSDAHIQIYDPYISTASHGEPVEPLHNPSIGSGWQDICISRNSWDISPPTKDIPQKSWYIWDHTTYISHTSTSSAWQVPYISDLAAVAWSDHVICCVPIQAYAETIHAVAPYISGSETVLWDICTVKQHTADILATYADEVRYICTHPMFGPSSYLKRGQSLANLRMVICDHTLWEETYTQTISRLWQLWLHLIYMTPDEHDRQLAETLFLTHYISQIVHQAWYIRRDIDTASFGWLMDAVESVSSDVELFRQVYLHNSYCREVVQRLDISQSQVDEMLGYGDVSWDM